MTELARPADVTVALPNFNNLTTLQDTLQSLDLQKDNKFALLISDNHSDDGSYDIIQNWVHKKIPSTVVQPPTHISYIEHLRYILEHVQTKYVVFLAGDDILSPNHIKLTNIILSKTSAQNAIFYRAENFTEDNKRSTRKRFSDRSSYYIRLRSLNSPLGNISGNVYQTKFLKAIFQDFDSMKRCGNCVDHYICVKATEGQFITSNYTGVKYRIHQGTWGAQKRQRMSADHAKFLSFYITQKLHFVERIVILRRLLISYFWSII